MSEESNAPGYRAIIRVPDDVPVARIAEIIEEIDDPSLLVVHGAEVDFFGGSTVTIAETVGELSFEVVVTAPQADEAARIAERVFERYAYPRSHSA